MDQVEIVYIQYMKMKAELLFQGCLIQDGHPVHTIYTEPILVPNFVPDRPQFFMFWFSKNIEFFIF